MSSRQPEPYIRMKNISQYVANNNKRTFTPFRFKPDGSMFYLVDGEEVPKDVFEKQYPITPIPPKRTGNPDKRHLWIHDQQSY